MESEVGAVQHRPPQVAAKEPESLERAALAQMATVGEEQDEVVEGLVVTLLAKL